MAIAKYPIIFNLLGFFFLFLSFSILVQAQTTTKFTFNGFKGNESEILTTQASKIRPDGSLRLTDKSRNVIGHAFYHQPIQMLRKPSASSPNVTVSSFSTSFVFVIHPSSSVHGGFGFAFALSPSPNLLGAEAGQYLGLLNSTNDGNSSNHIFAVEFDTVNGFKGNSDTTGNHVGININSLYSLKQESATYLDQNGRKEDFQLESGEPNQVWIDYDGANKILNVTVCPSKLNYRPSKPLISKTEDLSGVLNNFMYAGFSASTGSKSSSHYITGWSFSMNDEEADELDLSKLPLPPKGKKSDYDPKVMALIAALSIVTLLLLCLLSIFVIHKKRKMQEEVLEDWEVDYPHRFRYKDLYAATKGFKESEIIGVGGFGAVYRGELQSKGSELIATKKITPNSMQGLREFVAEIESLGRLRHKNLVNLQGWCKHKHDLLLIYDYIPNGSLDSLLYRKPAKEGVVLSWDQRFKILKGIASGLMYLHEEWEQVVIHRDVKSSNVLIDAEMNARLGDFGLARLYDHGTVSHTTNVVGTIGYIAPELARTGKASTSSDVFAYGVLLLEVVSGRKPTNSRNVFLADWVMELYENGEILEAVDPKLDLGYDVEEVRLVLLVGLLCSHQNAAFRPSMKHVLRYLSGDDQIPTVDNYWVPMESSTGETKSRYLKYASPDIISRSYPSSSFSGISSCSAETVGR